jgi:hypothetical protein
MAVCGLGDCGEPVMTVMLPTADSGSARGHRQSTGWRLLRLSSTRGGACVLVEQGEYEPPDFDVFKRRGLGCTEVPKALTSI